MFLNTTVDERISLWRKFRDELETSLTPFEDTQSLWNTAPVTTRGLDPWDSQQWMSPWELLEENRFCPVGIALMIGSTLKLTTRFSTENILIKTIVDREQEMLYNAIYVQDKVLNINGKVCEIKDIPADWFIQFQHEIK